MNEQDLIEQREADKQRLAAAIDEFASEMKARAFQKVDEGYHGWDDPRDWGSIGPETRLEVEVAQLRQTGDPDRHDRKCVDAANFAMFARFISRKRRGVVGKS
jgi:hypothetical protein